MGLYRADSVALSYSNVEAAKQWWIDTFGCKVVRVPQEWDNPLPSDVALTLPGDSEPTILLSAQSEVEQARFDRPSPVATSIFCDKLKKAHEHLSSRGVLAGPIQDEETCSFLKSATLKGTWSRENFFLDIPFYRTH
jgi:hypothetical protein